MVRTAETVGFSVTPDLVSDIQAVSDFFAEGNRSAFLRMAVQEYRSRMRHAQMETFRADARRQLSHIFTEDEVRSLVADTIAHG